jgi:hypothetical protein
MDADGRIYVLEVNPLPGLTPGYSDLVLIAQAVGMEYDQLIAEIMVGGLRRMRDKRREERELEREREAKDKIDRDRDKADKNDRDKTPDRDRDRDRDKADRDKSNGDKANGDKDKADKPNRRVAKPEMRAASTANGNGNGNPVTSDGTVRAVRRERSEPVAATPSIVANGRRGEAAEGERDSEPIMPASAGSTTTH